MGPTLGRVSENIKIIEICPVCQTSRGARFCAKNRSPERFRKGRRRIATICDSCASKQAHAAKVGGSFHPLRLMDLVKRIKGGAYRRGLTYQLRPLDIVELWRAQRGKCALSGVEMTWRDGPDRVSIDRIDNDEGYTRGNVQLVCAAVNMMKQKMDLLELRFWCAQITIHQCEREDAA